MHSNRSASLSAQWVCAAALALALLACGQGPSAPAGEQPANSARGYIVVLDGAENIDVASRRALEAAPAGSVEVARRYNRLPMLHVRARSAEAAAALVGAPGVLRVEPEVAYAALSAQNLALIGQPAMLLQGRRGAGATVVVIDGPVEVANAAFGHCVAGELNTPACKLAAAVRFGAGDGKELSPAHATNVAAIALAVAPDARIASLDVFNGPAAYTAEILAAIDWALEHQGELNIAAINLSLGAGAHDKPCGDDALALALAWARASGIVPTVAAGNDGHPEALAAPACAPAAVSVGAVYDGAYGPIDFGGCKDGATSADRVACFSNSAPFLSLLAPGAIITAGGYSMAGTSQAAPHVAGAIAVLRAAFPAETANQLIARLQRSATSVVDPRNGRALPRLDLAAAAAAPAVELPLGQLAINQAASLTSSANVTLSLTPAGPAALAQVCLSNGPWCRDWQPFSPSIEWRLPAGSGARTVRAWFRDGAGNESAVPASATILVDTDPPADGKLEALASTGAVELRWSGFEDAATGIAGYRLVGGPGLPPQSCEGAPVLYQGPLSGYRASGLVSGARYGYRVCAVDNAGNWSRGVATSVVAN
jgi:subtilisin family serine protease